MSAPFNDNIPRERVVRDVREVEMRRDVHPSSLRSHDDDDHDSGRYERVVRREYRAGNDWSVLLKWVFPAILLGLVISGLMPSHDMHLDHDHGLLERASDSIHSIGDRFNEGISFLSGKIMHRPTMTEKARKAAWEAKQGVKDRLDSVTDSSSDMADRVTGSFSYLGDKISRTADQAVRAVRNKFSSSSKGVDATVRQAQRRASSLGRDAQDTLDDVKDRAYELSREAQNKLYKAKDSLLDRFSSDDDDVDAEEYDYIRPTRHMHLGRHRHHEREWSDVIPDRVKNLAKRNTPRPTEKRTAGKWSFFRMIREHPWISSLLALLAVLSIRPFFMSNDNSSTSGSMESTKRTALSGLALIIDRIGTFLGMIGDKVRHSENFSDLRRRSMDNQTSSDVRSDAPVSRTNVSSTVSADLPVDKTSSKVPEAPVESSKITDKSISTVPHNTHVAVKQTDFTRAKADQLKENLDSTQKAEGMQTPILGGR